MKFCTVMLDSCFWHPTYFHAGIDVWCCDSLTQKTSLVNHKQGKCLENCQCVDAKLRSGASLSLMHHEFKPSLIHCLSACKWFAISFFILLTLWVNATGKRTLKLRSYRSLIYFKELKHLERTHWLTPNRKWVDSWPATVKITAKDHCEKFTIISSISIF